MSWHRKDIKEKTTETWKISWVNDEKQVLKKECTVVIEDSMRNTPSSC